MTCGEGGDFFARKRIFNCFWPSCKLFKNDWVTALLFLHHCNIKTFNVYVYNILKLILAYNCRYKLKHFINNTNSLDLRLLIVHPTIILPIYTDNGVSHQTLWSWYLGWRRLLPWLGNISSSWQLWRQYIWWEAWGYSWREVCAW